ncbi:MAG: chemotaxis protein CheW [Chitinophagaceae bacterium]|nr:chemotaxis protein CheW [Anaerolineae bacterium]
MTDEQTIDWKSLWRELDWDDATRNREANERRLQHRARQYAALLPTASSEDGKPQVVLAFQLGGERYAIDVMCVRAVRAITYITPVPGVPRFYRGVVNLRGQITTVMDLRLFFEIDFTDQRPPEELALVRANNLEIGILAHHVEGVMDILPKMIESLPDVRYARGVTSSGLVLLDIESLFADERLIVGGTEDRMD